MSNVYGVAHFAKQNAVPQVEWKNIDIIGQYIDNLNKQKKLEMMDKSYELAKDQYEFAKSKHIEDSKFRQDEFNWKVNTDDRDYKFNVQKHIDGLLDSERNRANNLQTARINNSNKNSNFDNNIFKNMSIVSAALGHLNGLNPANMEGSYFDKIPLIQSTIKEQTGIDMSADDVTLGLFILGGGKNIPSISKTVTRNIPQAMWGDDD